MVTMATRQRESNRNTLHRYFGGSVEAGNPATTLVDSEDRRKVAAKWEARKTQRIGSRPYPSTVSGRCKHLSGLQYERHIDCCAFSGGAPGPVPIRQWQDQPFPEEAWGSLRPALDAMRPVSAARTGEILDYMLRFVLDVRAGQPFRDARAEQYVWNCEAELTPTAHQTETDSFAAHAHRTIKAAVCRIQESRSTTELVDRLDDLVVVAACHPLSMGDSYRWDQQRDMRECVKTHAKDLAKGLNLLADLIAERADPDACIETNPELGSRDEISVSGKVKGDADLRAGKLLIDFKCANQTRTHDRMQLMYYAALSWQRGYPVERLAILNPVLGLWIERDVSSVTPEGWREILRTFRVGDSIEAPREHFVHPSPMSVSVPQTTASSAL